MAAIASLKRLEQLGLDKKSYGSCSEPIQKSVKNVGRGWVNRGCDAWPGCPWRDEMLYIQPRDENDGVPRPRNVVVKLIKPNPTGPGDRIVNSYCACFQALGKKRRDGMNNEIVEIVSGEGSEVVIKGSKQNVNMDKTIYFTPVAIKKVVPRFPDPTEVSELFEDIYAGQDRIANKAATVDADRQRRLTGAKEKQESNVEKIEVISARGAPPKAA